MRLLSCLVIATLAFSGCSGLMTSKKIDYKSADKLPALEIPPDLSAPPTDGSFAIPDTANNAKTASALEREKLGEQKLATPATTPVASADTVLPSQDKAHIERSGSQRWLVVQATPEQVWPILKEFWQANGFILDVDTPATGVMETDWAENRAKIPQDGLRNLLGKVIDSVYSTSERDKFRTRVEKGANGTTEIYISHRGMQEVFTSEGHDSTKWQPRPVDPGLEAEMLRRVMLKFGVTQAKANAQLAQKTAPDQAHILDIATPTLEMNEEFDRAWRRVGLALDRVGFAVEDRDRVKGIYYVRYIDPDADNASKSDGGIFSKLAFWKSKKAKVTPPLQIKVAATGDKTQVTVTAEGQSVEIGTQLRIVKLLYKELK
jgi:outer membrane protein assembly factor BamC